MDLAYPGATSTYEVTIKNEGNIDAKLSSVTDLTTLNAAAPADIKYTVTGATVDSVLAAGASTTVSVKVEWLSTSTGGIASQSKTATIEFNYVQS